MAGGGAGAASGAILGLALLLLVQQFGYLDFSSSFENPLVLLLVVVIAFAVVFGLVGRALKGRAIRKAEAQAGTDPAGSG